MIYVVVGGRCGNQLFDYSFARMLQQSYPDEELTFDFSWVKQRNDGQSYGEFWENSLERFNLKPFQSICCDKDLIRTYGSKSQKFLVNIIKVCNKIFGSSTSKSAEYLRRRMFYIASGHGLYFMNFGHAASYRLTKEKNKFLVGAFEDPKWFNEIREELVKEIIPNDLDKVKNNVDLLKRIKQENSVCISMRKWSIDVHDDSNLKNRSVCTPEFYKAAIQEIKKRISNPLFIVFSDDVEWAKDIMGSLTDGEILSESGDDDVDVKLYLMSSCKHFIISNSTFSWWAQYLGNYQEKVVVGPSVWLENFGANHPLIQNEWIKIDREGSQA